MGGISRERGGRGVVGGGNGSRRGWRHPAPKKNAWVCREIMVSQKKKCRGEVQGKILVVSLSLAFSHGHVQKKNQARTLPVEAPVLTTGGD